MIDSCMAQQGSVSNHFSLFMMDRNTPSYTYGEDRADYDEEEYSFENIEDNRTSNYPKTPREGPKESAEEAQQEWGAPTGATLDHDTGKGSRAWLIVVFVLVVCGMLAVAAAIALTVYSMVKIVNSALATVDDGMFTPSPTTFAPSTSPPSSSPLTPEAKACNFLSLTSLSECRATVKFDSNAGVGDATTGYAIPSEIGLLTQLTYLSLSLSRLTGTIPAEISSLTQLQVLSLNDNDLNGTIPWSFSALTQLTLLSLEDNELTGTIPASISSLTQLQSLLLYGNQFIGTVPPSLCSHVTDLEIDCSAMVCDPGCCYDYSSNSCDPALQIACNFLSLSSLSECRGTAQFDSDGNPDDHTTGSTIPSEIGVLTQLTFLDFSNNSLTGTIPSTFSSLTELQALVFNDNQLTGTIPSSFSSLSQLTYLAFADNKLSGTIPSNLSNLMQLSVLFVQDNQLTGTIPSSISKLTQLTYLGFQGNALTGTIPSSISNLTQLETLALYTNNFTGTITSSISRLTQLTYLGLFENQLTGAIPSSLSNLTRLTKLAFAGE